MGRIVCRTVAELRAALADFPDDAVPLASEPPFDGVGLVEQDDGKLLIAPPIPWSEYMGRLKPAVAA